MSPEAFLARLSGVRRNGTGWQALCPAHEDRNPSLSVTAHEGKILLFCHAGCSVEAICAALGISVRDLFTENSNHGNRNQDSEWGKPWPDGGPLGKPVAVYDYCDEASTLLFQVGRFERIKNGEREKTFREATGSWRALEFQHRGRAPGFVPLTGCAEGEIGCDCRR